jgi:adenylate cyclase
MLAELLGPDPSLGPVAEQLLTRTAGNPFFIEEMVRSLADEGTLIGFPGAYRLTGSATTLRVPATVQAVLAARIDRLDGAHKAVLQSAAVIGRIFSETVLRRVAEHPEANLGAALNALCSAELLQATGSEGEFQFWHPLTQEVAYGSLVTTARRRLHARTAQALIATAAHRQDELAALLVTHFDAAEEHLEAARWEIRAGSRALGTDLAEAMGRMHSALRHLAAVPASAEAISLGVKARGFLLRLGGRTGMDLAESDRIFAEGRADAEQLDDPAPLGALLMSHGAAHMFGGDISGALSLFAEGCQRADRSLDSDLRAWAWASMGIPLSVAGPAPEALRATDVALGIVHGDPLFHSTHAGYNIPDYARFVRAVACTVAGRLDEARQLLLLARDCYERRPVADWRCWTLAQFAHLADCSGDPDLVDEAARTASTAMRVAVDAGSGVSQVVALQATGVAALLAGRTGEAIASLEDALDRARTHGIGWHEAGVLAHLARAHLARGDGPAAQKNAEDSIVVARRQGARVFECLGHLVRARVWRETAAGATDLAEARGALQAADALATETGAGTYAAFVGEERARLNGGDLAAVAMGYETIGALGHGARIRAELA